MESRQVTRAKMRKEAFARVNAIDTGMLRRDRRVLGNVFFVKDWAKSNA